MKVRSGCYCRRQRFVVKYKFICIGTKLVYTIANIFSGKLNFVRIDASDDLMISLNELIVAFRSYSLVSRGASMYLWFWKIDKWLLKRISMCTLTYMFFFDFIVHIKPFQRWWPRVSPILTILRIDDKICLRCRLCKGGGEK